MLGTSSACWQRLWSLPLLSPATLSSAQRLKYWLGCSLGRSYWPALLTSFFPQIFCALSWVAFWMCFTHAAGESVWQPRRVMDSVGAPSHSHCWIYSSALRLSILTQAMTLISLWAERINLPCIHLPPAHCLLDPAWNECAEVVMVHGVTCGKKDSSVKSLLHCWCWTRHWSHLLKGSSFRTRKTNTSLQQFVNVAIIVNTLQQQAIIKSQSDAKLGMTMVLE